MFYWMHSYKLSSGKNSRVHSTIHTDETKARENLILMGGELKKLQEVE